ncbi:hypothetical protein KC343_g6930 [Hortaea werneckii]|nr:hypothetical protein KC352_g14691 [Hortaea werneckii]KAI7563669.1 hypothetical protein KC317_g7584 [Hortaea werneckii]KAI7617180.1 hypothetical protein KC346_g5626 [Hortaea werneckii]KAI7624569.1 hypothetical protein KC343_g6930 [Hortaea werneckii]KAI7666840.1 hypothetical protein KC319_g6829 [Hortaea werneckii]
MAPTNPNIGKDRSGGKDHSGSGPPAPKKPSGVSKPRIKGPKCRLCKAYGHIKKFCPAAGGAPPPPSA